MNTPRSVCVYCGSSPGKGDIYLEAATALGQALAHTGLRLVYGGGSKGLMGAVARAAIVGGGKVTGIIPRFLVNREASEGAPDGLDDLVIVETMHERKHLMFERSDAFVALPGGIGTLEEIVEIMTWGQLGHHRKPIVFADIGGFWTPMLQLMDHMRGEGFIHTGHLVQPLVITDPAAIVPAILTAGSVETPSADGVPDVIEKL